MGESLSSQTKLFQTLAHSASLEKRTQAVERLDVLPDEAHFECAMILFDTPYRDLWEAVLESCSAERVSSNDWQESMTRYLTKNAGKMSAQIQQALVICIRRMEGELPDVFKTFYHDCLKSDDADVRYQAFCVAELQEETSEAYLKFVKEWIESKDQDFRIIAIQAISRLKPDWGLEALRKRAIVAYGDEAFHLVLAQMAFELDDDLKSQLEARLIAAVSDSRFSFPAIQAVVKHHVSSAVPALIKQARRFFTEPTIRVAAAGAAARLGSEDGRALLVKFASSKHGNPEYASELLSALEKDETSSKSSESES